MGFRELPLSGLRWGRQRPPWCMLGVQGNSELPWSSAAGTLEALAGNLTALGFAPWQFRGSVCVCVCCAMHWTIEYSPCCNAVAVADL